METTKQKLVDSLQQRFSEEIAPQNPVKYLTQIDINIVINVAISTLYLYTRAGKGANKRNIYMAEVISAIGHAIRNKFKLKRDSASAARGGAFILYSFEQEGILKVKLGAAVNGHAQYIIEVLDDEKICYLWEHLESDKIEKLPSTTPYEPWTSTKHETGAMMVKTNNKEVLDTLTPETHPLVFENLNKSQQTGWMINDDIYPIFTWALRNRTDAFSDVWEMQNPEAKASKIREIRAVESIAKRFIGKVFYHLYYYDFRGRKYPATAYLHEQGTDVSKGLLLRADYKPIGREGFDWLLVSIANSWAGDAGRDDGFKTDKIPLKDRILWARDNIELFISYAENPKVNQGWMKADKPWQFLAACMELRKIKIASDEWLEDPECGLTMYDYCSHLEVFIDGSNNGSQHLSALTRDDITAPHVNLVPSDLPGDLYKYVADHVWGRIHEEISKINTRHLRELESLIDTLTDMKLQINEAPLLSDRRKQLIEEIIKFKKDHKEAIKDAAPVFWNRITDIKHKRKIVKRNVMTLPYGGTAYGLGEQQIDDARKHGIESLMSMEHIWGSYMGRLVFDDCKVSLRRPMQLLSVFEAAGKSAETQGRFLKWIVPITNFPVVQHYTEGTWKRVYIQYGPPDGERNSTGYYNNTLQIRICFLENPKPSKRKQSQGASPNAIHSLDAAHLALTVTTCPFNVTTIHDSFGCLLADMPDLYRIVRDQFVRLYKQDPLKQLMEQIDGDLSNVEIGSLDINLITESEYCFA